jgi:hypothetical protein
MSTATFAPHIDTVTCDQVDNEMFEEACQKLAKKGFLNDELNRFWLSKHGGDLYKTLSSLHDVPQYY